MTKGQECCDIEQELHHPAASFVAIELDTPKQKEERDSTSHVMRECLDCQ